MFLFSQAMQYVSDAASSTCSGTTSVPSILIDSGGACHQPICRHTPIVSESLLPQIVVADVIFKPPKT